MKHGMHIYRTAIVCVSAMAMGLSAASPAEAQRGSRDFYNRRSVERNQGLGRVPPATYRIDRPAPIRPGAPIWRRTETPGVYVDVIGVMTAGTAVIGGETTGFHLTTADGRQYDLDMRGQYHLERAAWGFDGRQVRVRGFARHIFGVERPVFVMIEVRRLTEAVFNALPPRPIRLQGVLRHGVIAESGETTGTELEAGGRIYELSFDFDPWLQWRAERLDGQTAIVEGTLTYQEGLESGVRRVVHAIQIDSPYHTLHAYSPFREQPPRTTVIPARSPVRIVQEYRWIR